MKVQIRIRYGLLLLFAIAIFFVTVGCTEQTGTAGPRVWIDTPRDNWSVPSGGPVTVVSHAYGQEGVADAVLFVDGAAYQRSSPTQSGPFVEFTHQWSAAQEGNHYLQVKAYLPGGALGESESIRVRVIGKSTPTPVVSPPVIRAPDLAPVGVEAVVAGYKGDVPFCNPHVRFRNIGSAAVPRDFTIQFDFEGTTTFANTVAGGLEPGATADITFVHQFIGSPRIGIHLDSTNVIAEQDETNNSGSATVVCTGAPEIGPGPTLVPSLTFTPTPRGTLTPSPVPTHTGTPNLTVTHTPPATATGTRVPTRTPTNTPTSTLKPTRTPTPPPPSVNFRADDTELARGECTMLRWDAENVTAVYLDGQGVAGHGTSRVCPTQTATFALHVETAQGSMDQSVTVKVIEGLDTTPPPVPEPQVPQDGLDISCRSTQALAWLPVTDKSGVRGYYVKLERQVTAATWQSLRGWGPLADKQVSANVQCGIKYRWAVRAADNANNVSDWSGWSAFSIRLP